MELFLHISVCDEAVCHECQENVGRGGDKDKFF